MGVQRVLCIGAICLGIAGGMNAQSLPADQNMQSMGDSCKMPAKLDVSGFVGGDVTSEDDGSFNVTPIGQAILNYNLGKNSLHVGVSLRPYVDNGKFSLARPFVTAANLTHRKGNFSFQAGVPDLLLGNTAYNTVGQYACGCSGNAPPDKAASMAGLYVGHDLRETNGAGAAASYAFKNATVTLGAISALQSDVFSRGEKIGYASAYYDLLPQKTRVIGNAAVSSDKQSYNVGVQKWFGEKFQGRVNAGYENERKRADVFILFYANEKNTFSFGGDYMKNKSSGSVNWTRAMNENWLLNARIDSAKNVSLGVVRKF